MKAPDLSILPVGWLYIQGTGENSHVLVAVHPEHPDVARTVFNLDLDLPTQVAEEHCEVHSEFLCPLCFDVGIPTEENT